MKQHELRQHSIGLKSQEVAITTSSNCCVLVLSSVSVLCQDVFAAGSKDLTRLFMGPMAINSFVSLLTPAEWGVEAWLLFMEVGQSLLGSSRNWSPVDGSVVDTESIAFPFSFPPSVRQLYVEGARNVIEAKLALENQPYLCWNADVS